MSLLSELRRRNVLRMAVLYVVAAWLIMQVAEVLMTLVGLPLWTGRAVFAVLALGFPIALIFSWFYELTTEGISLERDVDPAESITHVTGRRLDFVVISLLAAALLVFAYDKWWTLAPPEQSIAVLPFANMSDDASNEYFSDGISEEILNLLAGVPELRVTSRSSAFSFKGQNLDVPTMAARLNVAHVLEGSVRRSGNQLRITTQLIEVETDTHLWSETYNRELKNVFAIQDEIASSVVDALKITILGEEPKATETNPEAYALYLQGRYHFNLYTEASIQQAELLLKQALEVDSGFVPAWTELGIVYHHQADPFGLRPFDEGYELARDAIEQALALDPQNGRAYAVLGWIELDYDWDFAAASQHLKQALKLSPGDDRASWQSATLNRILGRVDEAIDFNRRSVALDPLSPNGHARLGRTLYEAYRLDEAADSFKIALSLSPGWLGAHYRLGRVLLAHGDASGALVEVVQETADAYRLTGTAIVRHALGDAGASDAALRELIECCAAAAAFQVAEVYAFRGEVDHSFDWLKQAYDNRDTGMPGMLLDPLLANLRNDPRWEPFLDKMGLPH